MDEKAENKTNFIKGLSLLSLGWELAIPIFIGVLLGYQLDKLLGTRLVFTLILLLLGIATGFYNLYKVIQLEMLRTKVAQLIKREEMNEE
jgi:predicted F0F1-ATPase subunit